MVRLDRINAQVGVFDRSVKEIHGGWLTVNRACNLRCEWCYAAGTEFDLHRNMDFALAIQLLDLLKAVGARSIVLIGGEPTVYPRLPALIERTRAHGIAPALITNGIRLASRAYCQSLKDAGLSNITVSVKGASQEQYVKLTKSRGFTKMIEGVANLRSIGVDPTFEITVVKDYLPNLEDMFESLIANGVNYITIDLASPVVDKQCVEAPNVPTPFELRDAVHRIYQAVDGSRLDYVIYMTIPFCLLQPTVLASLKEQGRLMSSCHVPHGNAVIFDENARVLACNHMAEQPIGQYKKDFTTAAEFWDFWNNSQMQIFREASSCYPAEPCQSCPHWGECGGGCMIKWLYWDPKQYIFGPPQIVKGGDQIVVSLSGS